MIGFLKNILGQVCGKWIGDIEWTWAHWLEICTESYLWNFLNTEIPNICCVDMEMRKLLTSKRHRESRTDEKFKEEFTLRIMLV